MHEGGVYKIFLVTKPLASDSFSNFSYSLLSCTSITIFHAISVIIPISKTAPNADPTATVKQFRGYTFVTQTDNNKHG